VWAEAGAAVEQHLTNNSRCVGVGVDVVLVASCGGGCGRVWVEAGAAAGKGEQLLPSAEQHLSISGKVCVCVCVRCVGMYVCKEETDVKVQELQLI